MAASKGEARIKHIDRSSVHRICSGQVVLDLATAVKELVENSLDAGSTNIDIRLKDHGSELIEVADNGSGVSPDNYQGLTLKYHTSKISRFADLQSLTSFGFRGEALSSLCALAKLTIITRTKDDPVAVRLEYDHSGLIVSQRNVARSIGTTVSVTKLFSPLPVRFKEFRRENNLRREYGRLLSVLQAYALIAKGVRIICSHQAGKAGRTVVVQTQGNTTLRDNLVTVFGTKTAACMESLDLVLMDTCSVEGFVSKPGAGCGRPSGDRQFLYVNGRPVDLPKVGKLLNEMYRSFNSLQYPMALLNFILPTTAYDVNVTPDKRKLFLHSENELLAALRGALEKVYTPTKYSYPINSSLGENGPTAGKRVASEKTLGGRSSRNSDSPVDSDGLTDACSDDEEAEANGRGLPTPSGGTTETEISTSSGRTPFSLLSFQRNTINGSSQKTFSGPLSSCSREKKDSIPQADKKVQAILFPGASSRGKRSADGSNGVSSEVPLLKRWKLTGNKKGLDCDDDEEDEFHDMCNHEDGEVGVCNGGKLDCNDESCRDEDEVVVPPTRASGLSAIPASYKAKDIASMMAACSYGKVDKSLPPKSSIEIEAKKRTLELGSKVAEARPCGKLLKHAEPAGSVSKKDNHAEEDIVEVPFSGAPGGDGGKEVTEPEDFDEEPRRAKVKEVLIIGGIPKLGPEVKVAQSEQTAKSPQLRPVIQFDMGKLEKKLKLGLLQVQTTNSSSRRHVLRKSNFAAATLNGVGKTDSEKEAVLKAATKELERSFNKADFKKMKVLGQFNLGFILAKIDDDIFIIDQHASDEKYNFERLSNTTVLNRQPLLRPLGLELSAAEEMTVLSHIETFRKNGFDFIENERALAGQRLQLSAVPFSKNVIFGVGDVQELISLLADQPVMSFASSNNGKGPSGHSHFEKQLQRASSWLPRPSRVRAMLASRACRSSVMIGDPLSQKEMERILSHLAELDAPWNCPHGRPTMRHLVDLNSLVK